MQRVNKISFNISKFGLFFSFHINLNRNDQARKLLEITHFVNLFSDALAQLKYSEKVKKAFADNRIRYEREKLEEKVRREIEDKEKRDFIEEWKKKIK